MPAAKPKKTCGADNTRKGLGVIGNKKDALIELELAIKNGFTDSTKLKEFNFKAIENEPKYKELLAQIKV